MKKKYLLILIILIFMTGCTSLNKMSKDDIIHDYTLYKSPANMRYLNYKYNLPRGMNIISTVDNSFKILYKNNYIYLRVNPEAFNNKLKYESDLSNVTNYSKMLNNGEVKIDKTKDGDYFLFIIYNYGKIEAEVKGKDLNEVLAKSLILLNSLEYNTRKEENFKIVTDNDYKINDDDHIKLKFDN